MMNKYVIGCAVLLSLLVICFLLLRRRDLKLSSKVWKIFPIFFGGFTVTVLIQLSVNVLGTNYHSN